MKISKYILWPFLAAFLAAGCTEELTYTAGTGEDPDNYGVYFPAQTSSTELEIDPSAETEVSYKVRRTKYTDAITVPVTVNASEEGIFEIAPIVFGPGEQETEFKVKFSKAEVGTKYTCDIRIEDPHYIEVYGKKSTSLSFSVIRAGWVLVKGDGGETKGQWRDNLISNMYSLSSSSFNPYPVVSTEIYQREDMPGYYRMKVYGADLMSSLVSGSNVYYESRDVWTIVDARDPQKVYIPYQSTGLTLVDEDGELWIASDVSENFSMDESAGQYGKLEDGVITFPAQSVMLEQGSKKGTFYYGNREGMLRIMLPGIVEKDYAVTLSGSEPSDGVVNVTAVFSEDAKSLKYSILEGTLDEGTASLQAQEMDAAQSFDATASPSEGSSSCSIRIENIEGGTGKYTLVGCIYDEENAMQGYAYLPFGYVAKGDERPVILNIGLEQTNEYAGQGLTSDNSVKFYAYGEGVESLVYGLFRTSRLAGADLGATLDAQGTVMSASDLEKLNGGHFSAMLQGLNGGSEYTLAVKAFNGYVTEIKTVSATTTGEFNPGKEVYYYSDFLPSSQQPSVNELTSIAWNYYAIDLMGEDISRRKIGKVTMQINESLGSNPVIFNIKGLSGLEFESGGDMIGAYMPNTSTFEGYNGAVALYVSEDLTSGVYDGADVILGFIPLENTYIYSSGYCMFMGEVYDGYMYLVSSPVAQDQGLTFSYLFTGSAGTPYSLMTEMLLVDPSKDKGGLPGAAVDKIASMRSKAMHGFRPANFVELPEFSDTWNGKGGQAVPVNLVNDPVPASAPSAKRVKAEISTSVPVSDGGDGTFAMTGVKANRIN